MSRRGISLTLLLLAFVALFAVTAFAKEPPSKLQIGVKHRPSGCDAAKKSKNGDKLAMVCSDRAFVLQTTRL